MRGSPARCLVGGVDIPLVSGLGLPQHATVDWPFKIRRAQATGVNRMLSGGGGGGGEKNAVALLVPVR